MDLVSIKGTSVNKLEKENRTMTFHKVEVQDSDKQNYLDRAMQVIKQAFYTHLCNDGEMYVVFRLFFDLKNFTNTFRNSTQT